MHLYVVMRGIKRAQDYFIEQLGTLKYPIWIRKDGQLIQAKVQLAIRPIQLYEIVFPEDSFEDVYKAVWPAGYQRKGITNWFISKLRYLFGAEKMPEVPKDWKPDEDIYREGVEVAGIGVKQDKFTYEGLEQL